ncbi:hypothetical protein JOJ86_004975 [Rhodococcus percolatus]|uniref:Uncharacterized protein n=1 Tax=Rhodococcus opacus TaxID=37919 RepID=A0AAX3Y7B8_RHOOP|nr:hypothetical protein [Rhodococcus opacus]MBA8963759.1 hypothetical protein [Rhodococcus opacus]MBP2207249.1 hypothetical protein [Rhodococcus opacus]MCZ4588259.1 hypothetical protein [Rhodococcus opacus]WLF44384.1 hypothetical protein Q5707_20630 [Rhodococcus opacus]
MAFFLSSIDAQFDPVGSTVGQAGRVRLTAENFEYAELRAEQVCIEPRNVYPGSG